MVTKIYVNIDSGNGLEPWTLGVIKQLLNCYQWGSMASPESNFIASAQANILYKEIENYTSKIAATSPRGQSVKVGHTWVDFCVTVVCSTTLMASLIRSVGGLLKYFYQALWLVDLNAEVIGQSINKRGVA